MPLREYLVLIALALGMAATPAFGEDINCREWINQCPPVGKSCDCDQVSPLQIKEDTTSGGARKFSATGGRAPYSYEIEESAAIDPNTGVITAVPPCGGTATVTVTDACKHPAQMSITFTTPLTITGPSAYIDGNFWVNKDSTPTKLIAGVTFSATGGVPPYTWTPGGGFTVNSSTGYVSAVSGGGICNSAITVTDNCGGSDTKSVTVGGSSWVLVQTDHYRAGNCYSPSSPYWQGCPADSPGHTYYCANTSSSWPYVPYSSIPCSESSYGAGLTCNCPSTGCFINNSGSWTTNRTQTKMQKINYYTSYCSGSGYLYEAENVYTYVWGCN